MTELYSSAGENEDRQWVKGCLHRRCAQSLTTVFRVHQALSVAPSLRLGRFNQGKQRLTIYKCVYFMNAFIGFTLCVGVLLITVYICQ